MEFNIGNVHLTNIFLKKCGIWWNTLGYGKYLQVYTYIYTVYTTNFWWDYFTIKDGGFNYYVEPQVRSRSWLGVQHILISMNSKTPEMTNVQHSPVPLGHPQFYGHHFDWWWSTKYFRVFIAFFRVALPAWGAHGWSWKRDKEVPAPFCMRLTGTGIGRRNDTWEIGHMALVWTWDTFERGHDPW